MKGLIFTICFVLLSLVEPIVSWHIRFPHDLGCCRPRCKSGFDSPSKCPTVTECPEGHYIRRCGGCCDSCEKFLQENDKCWQAMDLAFCRYGKCAPPLICSTVGTCLPPDKGTDWGRGDEFNPFEKD